MKLALPLACALALAPITPVVANPIQDADVAILRAVNGHSSPSGDVVYRVLSNDAQLFAVPLMTGYAVTGSWGTPVRVLESQLLAGVVTAGMKIVTDRPRPYETLPDVRLPLGPERLDSFPSGHASLAFAGATAIAMEQPNWAVPAYAWAGLVAYSRLYNGVHYPTDVLGGAALGVGSAFLASWLFSGLNTQLGVPAAGSPLAVVAPVQWSTSF